ncbi:MAG: hypothetical protein SAK29_28615 [Scytonema sp. PMC 1069.18]|nr:hypothetical protein [Scytonema sp. PMC 1069.18]MEC4883601.1 hypothetical protein [Scytonema sp. PMC 1070.18]
MNATQVEKLKREGFVLRDLDLLAQIEYESQSSTQFPFSQGIEWVQITPNQVVVATSNRAWLHQFGSVGSSDPLSKPMTTKGSISTTRNLLDGAIAAAKNATPPSEPPAMTPIGLVWRLASAYHLNHCTPPLMEEASRRFAAAGRKRLAEWTAQKAIEKDGHDELALLDIQSLGYDAEAVVKALVSPSTMLLVNYFTQSVYAPDPIDCVGYAHTLERLAICISEEYILTLEDLLPPNTNATRCLRVHSSMSDEGDREQKTTEIIAELTPEERTRVALACYKTALLHFTPPQKGYISDKNLKSLLKKMEL